MGDFIGIGIPLNTRCAIDVAYVHSFIYLNHEFTQMPTIGKTEQFRDINSPVQFAIQFYVNTGIFVITYDIFTFYVLLMVVFSDAFVMISKCIAMQIQQHKQYD